MHANNDMSISVNLTRSRRTEVSSQKEEDNSTTTTVKEIMHFNKFRWRVLMHYYTSTVKYSILNSFNVALTSDLDPLMVESLID